MNLDFLKQPDPSGKLSKENYFSKNYPDEYKQIILWCSERNITDITFKEKFYLFINKIDKIPVCKNPNCNNIVKFINSTLGYRDYCSNKCISSDPAIKKLKIEKSIEKFGSKTPSESSLIKDKIIKTNQLKYNANSPMCLESTKEKSKKTLMKNYGVNNPSKSSRILDRRINSFKLNIDKFKTSYKKTSQEKYGTDHPWENPEIHQLSVLKTIESKNNKLKSKIENKLNLYNQYELINIEFEVFKRNITIFCKNCNSNFNINREDFQLRFREKTTICTNCNPPNSNISGQQNELLQFIKDNYDGEILTDKKVIYPQQIDIYLPDLKIGFEFNGLYWHSESKKGKNYHIEKTKRCSEIGIELMHIWEDDWVYKNHIVKSIILNRLNKISSKIFARKCKISLVDSVESRKFLNKNHILGYCKSKVRIGLFYNNDLISLMTFKQVGFNYELSRFCSKINISVIGGFNKLFNFFIENYPNFIHIITYSDNSMFNGDVYKKSGFIFLSDIPIDYKWVIGKRRLHKSNFRKSKLIKLGYDAQKSENEIMTEDVGSYKLWNCGLKKWIYFKGK